MTEPTDCLCGGGKDGTPRMDIVCPVHDADPTLLDSEISHLYTLVRAGKNPDTGNPHITEQEFKLAIKNLLLEAKLDTLNKANEFYKSEPDIIGDYFKGAIGGIKAQLGVSK